MFQKAFPKLACALLLAAIVGGSAVVNALARQPEVTAPTASSQPAKHSCCSAAAPLLYCPLSDTINDGCCCDYVNGVWICRHTGAVLSECCCIPVNE